MVNTSITMPMPPFNARLSVSDLRTTFGRWLPLSKSILIHSRGCGGGWRWPPPPSSTWSFALHPLLCWWTNDQQQLIYFSGEVTLDISLMKFLWKIPDSCQISTLLIVVWLLSIIVVWLLSSLFSPDLQPSLAFCVCSEIQIVSVLLASSLWLLVIDVLLLQWFRKKRSFYFWEEGCICFFFRSSRQQQVYYYYFYSHQLIESK